MLPVAGVKVQPAPTLRATRHGEIPQDAQCKPGRKVLSHHHLFLKGSLTCSLIGHQSFHVHSSLLQNVLMLRLFLKTWAHSMDFTDHIPICILCWHLAHSYTYKGRPYRFLPKFQTVQMEFMLTENCNPTASRMPWKYSWPGRREMYASASTL